MCSRLHQIFVGLYKKYYGLFFQIQSIWIQFSTYNFLRRENKKFDDLSKYKYKISIVISSTLINQVETDLYIFDPLPPLWTIFLNWVYVISNIIWAFGKLPSLCHVNDFYEYPYHMFLFNVNIIKKE